MQRIPSERNSASIPWIAFLKEVIYLRGLIKIALFSVTKWHKETSKMTVQGDDTILYKKLF